MYRSKTGGEKGDCRVVGKREFGWCAGSRRKLCQETAAEAEKIRITQTNSKLLAIFEYLRLSSSLVQGLGDGHHGGLDAVIVTAWLLSKVGTARVVNPAAVGSGTCNLTVLVMRVACTILCTI